MQNRKKYDLKKSSYENHLQDSEKNDSNQINNFIWNKDWYFNLLSVQIILCLRCKDRFYEIESEKFYSIQPCNHRFCFQCLRPEVSDQFLLSGVAKCLFNACSSQLEDFDLMIILEENQFKTVQAQRQQNQLNSYFKKNNVITCTKCEVQFEFQQGKSLLLLIIQVRRT